jgi:hypothetical protein
MWYKRHVAVPRLWPKQWEVIMVAANARAVLQKENELLDGLIQTSATFMQGLSGVQADVLNDWGDYFKGWRETNNKLIAMTDPELDQHLDEEIAQLNKFRGSITGNSLSDQVHKRFLDDDIGDATRLRT